jgi:hypothetical protein
VTEHDLVTLEYRPFTGDARYYTLTVRLMESDRELVFLQMDIRQAPREIIDESSFIADFEVVSGVFKKNEVMSQAPGTGRVHTVTVKKNGEIIGAPVDFPFAQPSFPAVALKPGDCWRGDSGFLPRLVERISSLEPGCIDMIDYDFTLDSCIAMSGLECAIISVKCPEISFMDTCGAIRAVNGEGRVHFDHGRGALIGSFMEMALQVDKGAGAVHYTIFTKIDSGCK